MPLPNDVISRLDHMSQQMTMLQQGQEKIKLALLGDEAYGQKGVIKQVAEHAVYIEKEKNFKNKIYGAVVVVSAIISAGWTACLTFFKNK